MYDEGVPLVIAWMPGAKKHSAHPQFKQNCIPVPIATCFHFSFTRNDCTKKTDGTYRRQSLRGNGIHFMTLTGITGRCLTLSNQTVCDAERTFFPVVDDADEEDEPEEAGEEPVAVTHLTKNHLGWRLSYRTLCPDVILPDQVRKKLDGKRRAFNALRKKAFEPRRHRDVKDIQKCAEEASARKRQRERAYTRACGRKRLVPPPAEEGRLQQEMLPVGREPAV